MNTFKDLLYSRRFWLAVLALVQTAVFIFKPDFSTELWSSINEVLMVLIISITVENAGTFIATGINPSMSNVRRALNLEVDNKIPWLFRSRKFWLAVLALVQTVVFSSLPGFKPELWEAINNVIMVVIGMFAVEDTVATISLARKERLLAIK